MALKEVMQEFTAGGYASLEIQNSFTHNLSGVLAGMAGRLDLAGRLGSSRTVNPKCLHVAPQYSGYQSSQTLKAQGPKRECPREEVKAVSVSRHGPETGISSPLSYSIGQAGPEPTHMQE